jgi:hypothetical protein
LATYLGRAETPATLNHAPPSLCRRVSQFSPAVCRGRAREESTRFRTRLTAAWKISVRSRWRRDLVSARPRRSSWELPVFPRLGGYPLQRNLSRVWGAQARRHRSCSPDWWLNGRASGHPELDPSSTRNITPSDTEPPLASSRGCSSGGLKKDGRSEAHAGTGLIGQSRSPRLASRTAFLICLEPAGGRQLTRCSEIQRVKVQLMTVVTRGDVSFRLDFC